MQHRLTWPARSKFRPSSRCSRRNSTSLGSQSRISSTPHHLPVTQTIRLHHFCRRCTVQKLKKKGDFSCHLHCYIFDRKFAQVKYAVMSASNTVFFLFLPLQVFSLDWLCATVFTAFSSCASFFYVAFCLMKTVSAANSTLAPFTRHTEHSGVWNGLLVAVVLLCLVTDISATVAAIGVKFCMMVHVGPGCVFSPFGGSTPGGSSKSKILAL